MPVQRAYLTIISKVAARYAPSRPLSFETVHVLEALLLIRRGDASRQSLCCNLGVGEGTSRTLVKHLKMNGLVITSKAGTRLTDKGAEIASAFASTMPAETAVPKSGAAVGKFNYAVLVKGCSFAVRSGIEQRDAAIRIGGSGATTFVFREGRFFMPESRFDPLKGEQEVRQMLVEKLRPEDGDVVVIGSADQPGSAVILAARNAALALLQAGHM